MLKRTASGGERIVMAWSVHPSPSRSQNPSQNPSQSRNPNLSPSRNPSQSQIPNPSRSRSSSRSRSLSRSPSRSPSLRRSPSPWNPRSRRGLSPPAAGCHLVPVQQRPRLSLPPPPHPRHPAPPPSPQPSLLRLSRLPLLEPVHRSHARASRFPHPPADRLRPLRASRFPRPLVGAVGVRRRVRAGAHVVQSARQPEAKGRGWQRPAVHRHRCRHAVRLEP